MRRLAAPAVLLALVLGTACTPSDRRDVRSSVDAAATNAARLTRDAAARVHALASPTDRFTTSFARAATIEARLVADDARSSVTTRVTVSGSVARLRGRVASAATAEAFRRIAASVDGITRVDAKLTVDPNLPNPVRATRDLALEAAVRANLAVAVGADAVSLGVRAGGGDVRVTGHVHDAATKARIANVVRTTAGVKSVDDAVTAG